MNRFEIINGESQSETVQGLASYLEERGLHAYIPHADKWCAEMGAMYIDEVLEEAEAFAQALKLRPLEVKRFLGKPRAAPRARSPAPEVAPRRESPPLARSETRVGTARSREPPVPEVPAVVPAVDAGEPAQDSDALSAAPSTCATPEPASDGFCTVASKKSSRTSSDADSTCVSEVSTVKMTNGSILKPQYVPMYKTTFTITERQVGALLGPKGASLLSIERDTGAKVSVPKAGAKAPKKDETRAIVVTGPSKKCVDRAVQLCKARTAENVLDANLERLNADETTHSVAVDSRDVGALIGKDGATLRKLEQDTKTRISVSKDGAVRNVIVRGPEAHVAAAKEAIADLLRCVERTVEVPGWSVGEILGRGGKALDKLQKDTEARVDISKETTGPQDFRLVRIRARNEESASAAEEALLRIAHPRSHSIEVTSTEAGVLIGRKGETVKAIQKESGARLTIDASGNTRTVWITGPTIDNINQALNAMRDVIRDELPSERKTRTASPPRHLSGVYVSKR